MKRKKILFLCLGNTCRSPMAEYICIRLLEKYHLNNFDVLSAGFCVQKNSQLHPYTLQCLQENAFYEVQFRPKQITMRHLHKADFIFCMTKEQKARLENKFDNVYASIDLINEDIEDPFGGDMLAYRQVYAKIQAAIETFIQVFLLKNTTS